MTIRTRVLATGSYLPERIMRNEDFQGHTFYRKDGSLIDKPTQQIVDKLEQISEIHSRHYAPDSIDNTQMAVLAAEDAIAKAGIDRETFDQIIVAHNFGNVPAHGRHADLLPNLAARVKNQLGIQNENCVAYDLLFGCPGWVQGFIQAHLYFQAGAAKRILLIGADLLSRMVDDNDLDSMLFSDGAGATILEAVETSEATGLLAFKAVSSCHEADVDYIYSGKRINTTPTDKDIFYIKMNGRGVYKYGLEKVPEAIISCLKTAGVAVNDVKKFLIHQANGKMIKQMVHKVFEQSGLTTYPEEVLPLTVQFTGNSSVATVPTLWDLINKGQLPGHELKAGDVIVLASVGAGMHANCIVYRV